MMRDFRDSLVTMLREDTEILAWVQGNFPTSILTVLEGGAQSGQFREEELPGAIVRAQGGESSPAGVGMKRWETKPDFEITITWKNTDPNQDPAVPESQYLDLVDAVRHAVMRNGNLGIAGAQVIELKWSQIDTKEPVSMATFTLAAIAQDGV